MVFLNLYLQSFLFLLGKRDPCFAQLKLPVAGFERGSWVFWVHHQEEVGALAGMKAKRGPRFKSSDKAESKPLQWKISNGGVSPRNQDWIQELMDRAVTRNPAWLRSQNGGVLWHAWLRVPDDAVRRHCDPKEQASFLRKQLTPVTYYLCLSEGFYVSFWLVNIQCNSSYCLKRLESRNGSITRNSG